MGWDNVERGGMKKNKSSEQRVAGVGRKSLREFTYSRRDQETAEMKEVEPMTIS